MSALTKMVEAVMVCTHGSRAGISSIPIRTSISHMHLCPDFGAREIRSALSHTALPLGHSRLAVMPKVGLQG